MPSLESMDTDMSVRNSCHLRTCSEFDGERAGDEQLEEEGGWISVLAALHSTVVTLWRNEDHRLSNIQPLGAIFLHDSFLDADATSNSVTDPNSQEGGNKPNPQTLGCAVQAELWWWQGDYHRNSLVMTLILLIA